MIEINLVPDVKQELIKARRLRTRVASMSILSCIVAAGIILVLALYVFGGQTLRSSLADNAISSEQKKLLKVKGLANALTIQQQLSKLAIIGNDRQLDSRIFDVLSEIVPPAPNSIAISKTAVDKTSKTITLDAQADSGFAALEVFKKTIEATQLEYMRDNKPIKIPLASDIIDSSRSYGEDATGKKVLRFTISFTYPDELFARSVTEAQIIGPGRTNATDSYVGVPESLFTTRATDSKDGDQ